MEFQFENFSPTVQQDLIQQMQKVLQAYMDGLYQNIYFVVNDLIFLCQKRLITRETIHLGNHLSFLIAQWQERGVADGGQSTEQEMQAIITQLMPLVVQAIQPDTTKQEKSTSLGNEDPEAVSHTIMSESTLNAQEGFILAEGIHPFVSPVVIQIHDSAPLSTEHTISLLLRQYPSHVLIEAHSRPKVTDETWFGAIAAIAIEMYENKLQVQLYDQVGIKKDTVHWKIPDDIGEGSFVLAENIYQRNPQTEDIE